MPPAATPVNRIQQVSGQITRVFTLLLIFTNVMLGLLLYFQFDQQLTKAWNDRYQVPLGHLAKDIEYGLQLGFSLETMENLPKLLAKTTQRYPELTSIFVSDRQGKILAHTLNNDRYLVNLIPILSKLNGLNVEKIKGLTLNLSAEKRVLIWSIPNPFGDISGFVFMELPLTELHQAQESGQQRLILGIAGIIGIFLLLSVGLFRLLCKDLELNLDELNACTDMLLTGQHCILQRGSREMVSAFAELAQRLDLLPKDSNDFTQKDRSKTFPTSSRFKTKILTGALILLLGSCVASTTIGYLIFRDLYLPILYSQSRIIGQSLGDLVSEMREHGIPVDKMHGMRPIFATLIKDFPQIAAIGLYDEQGKRVQSTQQIGMTSPPEFTPAQGLDDPASVSVPILYKNSFIGMVRLDKVPHYFANRLMDIALDVLALLVVSILIASELLVFIVRFLVAVPLEDLVRALRGDSLISQKSHDGPTTDATRIIKQKILTLAEKAAINTPPTTQPSAVRTDSSPLMPYVRPPLFLVVFADALSIAFFPLYAMLNF